MFLKPIQKQHLKFHTQQLIPEFKQTQIDYISEFKHTKSISTQKFKRLQQTAMQKHSFPHKFKRNTKVLMQDNDFILKSARTYPRQRPRPSCPHETSPTQELLQSSYCNAARGRTQNPPNVQVAH